MSAIRKLFSRKKDKEPERGRGGSSVNTDTLRASAYDSVSPGGAPQTGAYPIKGNANSPSVAGRQTSTARNRAPSASRHNVRKSEIPMSMKAVPPHTENRPRSSPGFKNETAPAVRHSSANQNTDNGFAPTHRNVSDHQTNNVAPGFHHTSASHNTGAETSRPFNNINNNDSAMHNYNSYQNGPSNANYEPRAVNAGMSGRDDVAPGTALTTDDGNASELPLHSTMSPNRNMESTSTPHYSRPEVPSQASRASGPRQQREAPPTMGTATNAPRQYNEDIASRNTSTLTAADLNTPEYSYLAAVYGEDIADRNIHDNKRKGPIPSQPATQPVASNNNVTNANNNSYLNGRGERRLSQDRDYNRNTMSSNSPTVNYSPTPSNTQSFDGIQRKSSIPRKQVGSDTSPSASPRQHQRMSYRERGIPGGWGDDEASSIGHSSPSHTRSSSGLEKPLPSAPAGPRGIPDGGSHRHHQADGYQPRIVSSSTEKPSLEGVVDLSNTIDTQVVETIAPAVIHEDVTKAVHHIREEVYTREIHTHDIYHRIQPVIDVEVLPPRHFLPVEGGGLVEVTAEEVPGRHGNWVIAETASRIPSDEPAPKKITGFSAAEFDETWDKKTYTTPEGIPRTEEVWVHPPELETGAWATGQTWRMDFGKPDEPINAIKPDSSYQDPSITQGRRSRRSSSANRGAVPGQLPKRTSNGSLANRDGGNGELPQRSSSLKGPLGNMVERQRERDRHHGQRTGAAY